MFFKAITKAVWILSLISLFTDAASEMLYPVMPIYLKSIGFSVVIIGILEGVAEAFAGLSKGYFGRLSDLTARRVPFVQIGYTLSAISKPLMGLFSFVGWIFFARLLDRLGKGVRTAARDAILADESTPETKGAVFGFHRSMDTFGAVIGPSIALIYLYYFPGRYIDLFLIAVFPGLFSIATTFFLKEDKSKVVKEVREYSLFKFFEYWKECNSASKKLFIGLIAFALVNSSDVFLLLKLKENGVSDEYVIGIYIFYNLIYALLAYPVGLLSDKLGLKRMFVFGLIIFAVVYAGMAIQGSVIYYCGIFVLYGLYAAATEGISKAWISKLTRKDKYATAFGFFTSIQSLSLLIASTVAGLIWNYLGANVLFYGSSIMVALIVVYFISNVYEKEKIDS
jgi:MFS family permease